MSPLTRTGIALAVLALAMTFCSAAEPPAVTGKITATMWPSREMLTNLQPGKDSSNELVVVTAAIANESRETMDLSSPKALCLSVAAKGTKAGKVRVPVKGIFMNAGALFMGVPKGMNLQTKGGWRSGVSLDPKKPGIATHFYAPVGEYKLRLDPGAKVELLALFEHPKGAREYTLQVHGTAQAQPQPAAKAEEPEDPGERPRQKQ